MCALQMANEVYRQSIHLIAGLIAAIFVWILPEPLYLLAAACLVICAIAIVFFGPGPLKWVFTILEREHVAFKGKGLLFFSLGIFLCAALFWEHAGVALLVLAIPDSAATIVGSRFHSAELPYNHRKTFLGSGVFFLTTILVLAFVRFNAGVVLAAFLLTALESFDYREIPFLDDNLVIPVVAGYLLSLPW